MLGLIQYPARLLRATRRQTAALALPDRRDLEAIGLHLLLVGSVLLIVFPILVAAIVSTKQTGIVTSLADLAPGGHVVENYRTVLVDYQFGRFMLNSFLMATVIVIGKLALSIFAATAIVYYDLPYKDLLFLFILFTLLLPVPVRFIPLFQLVADMGWTNSMLAITVPYLASATTVFILRQHFLSIPSSIVETAKLDGVGPLKFMAFVLLPMSKGILVGVSVIMFVFAWNQYLWPLVIINAEADQVAQVGLALLEGDVVGGEVSWSLVMAGSMLTLLPPLLLLILFRKPLLQAFVIQQK
ncbi:glycerol-3-phosphate ABC transporter permease [Halobacteriales archaeon SW_10_66_29]|nr:MAG: glycerol-3-phosphate ABC transporter permease [Halobacteriales archaeon SW_10_66_29]